MLPTELLHEHFCVQYLVLKTVDYVRQYMHQPFIALIHLGAKSLNYIVHFGISRSDTIFFTNLSSVAGDRSWVLRYVTDE